MTRALLYWPILASGCWVAGCATSKPAAKPERQECTTEAAAEIAAACYLRVKTECVDKGVAKEDCVALKECDDQADKRLEECRHE